MDFDYKKYSLEKLEEWVHDAINGDASPHEIYSTIRSVIKENLDHHKEYYQRCLGLYELMSGNRPVSDDELIVSQKKWIIPVEEVMDEDTYEISYAITFPQDLLDQTKWVEGDELEWIDCSDGSFQLRKVSND